MRRRWLAASGLVACAACADIFHSTDFETLCSEDARACADAGSEAQGAAEPPPEAGPVDFCKWSPSVARQHATRACAWMGACVGPMEESAFGPCMARAIAAYDCKANPGLRPRGAANALWHCLADVSSCDAVNRCILPNGVTCRGVDAGTFSDCVNQPLSGGSALAECGHPDAGPPVGVEPCLLEGRSCQVSKSGSPTMCAGSSPGCPIGRSCSGTKAVDCRPQGDTTVDFGVDCQFEGAGRCADDGKGVACAPSAGADCNGSSPISCDGGVATSCVEGKEVTIDCPSLGGACDADAGAPPHDPARACTAATCPGGDRCDGDTVTSCLRGLTFEVKCTSSEIGLGPCTKANGRPFATCTPP